MVLAKIYCISSSSFTSAYGDDFLDCDAVLPFQENEFTNDNFMSLKVRLVPDCTDDIINHSLNVRCRHFTSEEIKRLESGAKCEENGEKYLHLIVWEEDVTLHGLRSGQTVDIEMLPVKLSQVILTARYDKNGLQDPAFLLHNAEHLLFDTVMTVGKKKVLELQHEGRVVEVELEVKHCEPVTRGTTDASTKWFILDASYDSSLESIDKSYQSNVPVDIKDNPLPLLIADFVSPLRDLWDENLQDKTKQLKIEVNYWNDLHLSFIHSRKNQWKFDENDTHCIYVSMETLMELQVHNGSWVKVWLHKDCSKNNTTIRDVIKTETIQTKEGEASNCSTTKCDQTSTEQAGISELCHYVQLLAINPIEKALDIYIPNTQQIQVLNMEEYMMKTRKMVHVSPVLMFNLLQSTPNNDSSELFLNLDTDTIKFVKPDFLNTTAVSFAQDAHLSLVNTPLTNPGDAFDESLKRHFSKPRLLTVGDVVCIDFDCKKDSVNSMVAEECSNLKVIYFKVKRLVVLGKDEASGLVDTDHTTVYQTTSVHSFVPTCTQSFVNKSNYWLLSTPPGLHEPTKELISIIKPYLTEHVNMMPAVLLTGPKGVGKTTVVMAIGRKLGVCVMNINCYDLIGESVAATESRITNIFHKAMNCRPCLLLLRNIDILIKDRDGLEDEPRIANTIMQCIANLKEVMSWPLVVIATSSSDNPLSAQLYSCFLHEVSIPTPTEPQRRQIIEALASMCLVEQDVSFCMISKKTAGLVLADIVSLFTKAANNACKRLLKQAQNDFTEQDDIVTVKVFDNMCDEGIDQSFNAKISQEDFEEAIETIRTEHSDTIGAPKIPNVSWQDIGGLMDVKEELLDTIQLPLQHPELFASGLRRSGVLLYGPPGTGKTLLAKAVATECSLNFLSVKGPELINMYVGQSEQNVRQVFSRAQSATPCVIFFDELDSLAPNRGRSGDSGGVMDRVVSQLLAELDGLHKSCDVFVIGATNRPDLLDPALLRPGRFDKLLYLGISEDHEAQLKILQALTKKFELDPGCNLETISNECPLNFTGADLYALCSDAMLNAIKRTVSEQQDVNNEAEPRFFVKQEDFQEALQYLTPSVPEHELQRYQKIQQQLLT